MSALASMDVNQRERSHQVAGGVDVDGVLLHGRTGTDS